MQLFVSYAHVDAVFAAELGARLMSGGLEPWWDNRLHAGDDWKAELRAQIDQCAAFVCLISPDFLASEWCQWELRQAIVLSRFILPILAREGCSLPPAIRSLQYVDLSKGVADSDIDRLVARLTSLKQHGALNGAFVSDAPVGLPSRFVQPLPSRYQTVAQGYLRPASPGMHRMPWPDDPAGQPTDARIVGIDFGTTMSAVGHCSGGSVRLIPNEFGEVTTPSAVAIGFDGMPLIGRRALDFLLQRPERGVVEPKRLLGQRVAQRFGGAVVLEIDGVSYRPVDLAALVLHKLRSDAVAFFGANVRKAVMAAPAHFDPSQLSALSEAARLAGWQPMRIVPEPVAACLGSRWPTEEERDVVVYDLGGGTFDVSVLAVGAGTFEVKSVNGDTELGGIDLDRVIVDYCADEFAAKTGIDLRGDGAALMRIREAAERAKIELSSAGETTVSVPFITSRREVALHLDVDLSRTRYHQLTHALVARTIELTRAALADAGHPSVDDGISLLVVGRAARAPSVRLALADLFGHRIPVASDDIVARGAAFHAGTLSGDVKDSLLLDATTHTLRVQVAGNRSVPVVYRHTSIPTRKSEWFQAPAGGHPTVLVRVLCGETSWPDRNTVLFQFDVPNSPQTSGERARIQLEFDIDANSVLCVRALDEKDGVLGRGDIGLRHTGPAIAEAGIRMTPDVEAALPLEDQAFVLGPLPWSAFSDVPAVQRWLAENAVALSLQRAGSEQPLELVQGFESWLRKNPGVTPEILGWNPWERTDLIDLLEHRMGRDLPTLRGARSIEVMAHRLVAAAQESEHRRP